MDALGGMLGVIAVLSIMTFMFLAAWASFYGNYIVLKSCFGLSMLMSAVLLFIPGLNMIGSILLAISGFMLLTGKCNVKKGLSRKSRSRSRSR